MNTIGRVFLFLLALLNFLPTALNAQCGFYGTYDLSMCNDITRQVGGGAFSCTSGHCRWDFTYGTNYTMVSRTTNFITLLVGQATPTTATIGVTMYDSINNCTATMTWADHFMQQTFPTIIGTIPACPVPAQVYTYTCGRYPTHPFAPSQETITWSISGGTIQSVSNSLLNTYPAYDTVRVTWNTAGPHRLIASRVSSGTTSYGSQMCTNRDTIWDGLAPPVISGANAVCGGTIGTYSIPFLDPAFTYSWSCSNGTITAGQGSANVTVNWLGSGVLTLTRTSIACGWTDSYTKNVTISASAAPVPVLPPTATVCAGQSVALYPGVFSSYAWSNLYTSAGIAPTTAGTYTVTVTNAAGCQATASSVVSSAGTPPTPNLGPNQTVCVGTTVTLNPGSFSSYLWNTGATTPTISPTTSGTYSVTVTNASGCTANDAMILTVNTPPSPNLGPDQTTCAGTPVTLNPGTFSAYLWSTGATTPTISPTVSGTYSVTVTGSSGCTGNDAMVLTVNSLPNPNLGPNQSICAGAPLTLNPGTFSAYLWNTGATTATISPTVSGTYSVTVTDANGCAGNDAMNLTVNANPVFSLGNDTLICADTTFILDGPTGNYTYMWSTGSFAANITIATGGTYQLTIIDINGCTATDAIVITGMSDCVFPGDANYDGVANNQDILSIGAYYGTAGPARPGASTQWYGQSLADWGGAMPLQADPKHSDCNGDGLVQAVDTLAVTLNYLQTHNKASGTNTGADLTVLPLIDSISPGDTAWFAIHLGDATLNADSVYGLAFTINHSSGGVLAPGLILVDYSNCWFAPNGQRLDFTQNMAPAASVDVAISRTDQQNQQGFGEVCRVAILTEANPASAQVPLEVWITGANLVDASLLPQAVLPVAGTTVISTTLAGIPEAVQPLIYPNPAEGWIQIELPGGQLERVEVYDALGKLQGSVEGGGLASLRILTDDWSAGMYLLRVHTSAGAFARMQAVRR